ncbi:BolA/IbaG family iron-sulfur metabolism protein [Neisseriaceae bacterium PsAf]|nr:BolA/IbaG family iron-sulfur metabolism protein [Neisseriaceae bacterium PsAf]MCV2503582.1 BolA family transcriptional regulator [Neisseriaceae bacterium]
MTEQEVKQILSDINLFYCELIDDSLYHRGHAGNVNNGAHYQLTLVSDDFQDLSKVQRHRLIYEKFAKELKTQIHALSLKIMTIKEWQEYKDKKE